MKNIKYLLICLISCNLHAVTTARATLMPTEGSTVRGEITFSSLENGVRIVANVEGLTPGKHGLHIHQYGDCSAPDAASAGEHYNPTLKHHDCPEDTERHIGDLGNISADKDGKAHYERIDPVVSLTGPYSILGKSVIVHEKADDCKSQPVGDSGKRMACGVILASD